MAKKAKAQEFMVLYKSGTDHWTAFPQVFKKDRDIERGCIKVTGKTKKNIFWFDVPLVGEDGSQLQYWPL